MLELEKTLGVNGVNFSLQVFQNFYTQAKKKVWMECWTILFLFEQYTIRKLEALLTDARMKCCLTLECLLNIFTIFFKVKDFIRAMLETF